MRMLISEVVLGCPNFLPLEILQARKLLLNEAVSYIILLRAFAESNSPREPNM